MTTNLFPQDILFAMDVAAQSAMPGTCDVCMDVNRTVVYQFELGDDLRRF